MRKVAVFRGSLLEERACQSIQVGDIVLLKGGAVPADLLVLCAASAPIWVHTRALDGESSLREKLPALEQMFLQVPRPVELAPLFGAVVEFDLPNSNLYAFSGQLKLAGRQTVPLTMKNLLLRGSEVVKSDWLIGLCVYCGPGCKIALNAAKGLTAVKQTILARGTNNLFLGLFAVIGAMSLFSATMNLVQKRANSAFFRVILFQPEAFSSFWTGLWNFVLTFFTFLILYNNFIPVSLVVTCEIVRWQNANFVSQDLNFWNAEEERGATVNCSGCLEDLGQISFIFTDKTGTLTVNKMQWKKLFIHNGSIELDPFNCPDNFTFSIEEHLLCVISLLICNSATPSSTGGKCEVRCAEDGAIVSGLEALGWTLIERNASGLCRIHNQRTNQTIECTILRFSDFTFERRRVTAIVSIGRDRPNYWLLAKGSDLAVGQYSLESPEIDQKVKDWSLLGMRTLVVSAKRLPSINGELALLEQGSRIICALAIEDKIGKGVPECVLQLREAGIKIFVVTGDKLETSATVAHSCAIIDQGVEIVTLTPDSIQEQLKDALKVNFAFAIDGETFDFLCKGESAHLMHSFLSLLALSDCKGGIFYRFSPLQKAKIVSHTRSFSSKGVLAIGDGTNDVGMIQAASVGIGIQGREGSQASRASDISIGEFSHLGRLLLVHGSWCYYRLMQVTLYSLYKNTLFYVIQFWFAFLNEFSGQTLFESWIIGLYNVLFSFLPPFVIGLMEMQASEKDLRAHPRLYQSLKAARFQLNLGTFLWCLLNALFHSLLILGIVFGSSREDFILGKSGHMGGMWFCGCVVFVAVAFTVTLKACLLMVNWTRWSVLLMLVNLGILVPLLAAYFEVGSGILGLARWEFTGMARTFFSGGLVWALVFVAVSGGLVGDLCCRGWSVQWRPSDFEIIEESKGCLDGE